MLDRKHVIGMIAFMQADIRKHGDKNLHLLQAMCTFINSLFCECKYVEYWIFDLAFGQNLSSTELGFELCGLDTIEKFVDFLFEKHASNK